MLAGNKFCAKSPLCADCKDNESILTQWSWYEIVLKFRFASLIFLWIYPLIIIGVVWAGHSLVIPIVCWAVWSFNLYHHYKRNYSKVLQKERDEMFILKIKGRVD